MSILGSGIALGVDELTLLISEFKFEHRDNYWIWVGAALFFVAIAVASV